MEKIIFVFSTCLLAAINVLPAAFPGGTPALPSTSQNFTLTAALSDKPPFDNVSVDGLPVHGLPLGGRPVDGLSLNGLPVDGPPLNGGLGELLSVLDGGLI